MLCCADYKSGVQPITGSRVKVLDIAVLPPLMLCSLVLCCAANRSCAAIIWTWPVSDAIVLHLDTLLLTSCAVLCCATQNCIMWHNVCSQSLE